MLAMIASRDLARGFSRSHTLRRKSVVLQLAKEKIPLISGLLLELLPLCIGVYLAMWCTPYHVTGWWREGWARNQESWRDRV